MRNLAGKDYADEICELELRRADIPLVIATKPNGGEVDTRVTGKLGDIGFRRAWIYWAVRGFVPIEMAREMYADPIGRRAVRVAGHCGCPPPDEWSERWVTESGDGEFVDSYHIDTQEGLDLFVRMAHKYGIVENPPRMLYPVE